MKCTKCSAPMLCEQLSEQVFRYKCQKCGLTETADAQGRKLLTSAVPSFGRPLLG